MTTTAGVMYWSKSKQKFVAISEMATPHIGHAIKQLEAVLTYGEGEPVPTQPHGDQAVLDALKAEQARREAEQQASEPPPHGEPPDQDDLA